VGARIEHLGVAVPSLDEGLRLYRDLLGFEVEYREEVPSESVRVVGLKAGGTTIELLEPTAAESSIARHLERRGPGLHHLAVEVERLAELLPKLKAQGVQLLDETPRPGAGGTQVAFIHPRGALGVLVELVERPTPPTPRTGPDQ